MSASWFHWYALAESKDFTEANGRTTVVRGMMGQGVSEVLLEKD